MKGSEEKGEINGYLIEEIDEIVGYNSQCYIERFKGRLKKKRKFNWAAGIFQWAWFGYRRLYKEGIAIHLCEIAVGCLSLAVFLYFIFPRYLYRVFEYEEIEIYRRINTLLMIVYCYSAIYYVVRMIIVGFCADSLYWRRVRKRIRHMRLVESVRRFQTAPKDSDGICRGTSFWSVIGLKVALGIIDIVVAIAIFVRIRPYYYWIRNYIFAEI